MDRRYIDTKNINLKGKFSCGINEDGILYVPFREIQKIIDDVPTADVEEVKHGYWIKIRYQVYECSCCKRSVYLEGLNVTDENETKLLRELYPYCHCGAKMDKEEK